MQTLKTIWVWITTSSADPAKWSATIKYALLGVIPWVLSATSLACGVAFLHACVNVTGDELTTAVETISNIAFWLLSAVSGIGTLVAFVRKVYRTSVGTNAAINALG